MTEKFNNLYRIPSARLESFDYGSAADYDRISQYILNNPKNWKGK